MSVYLVTQRTLIWNYRRAEKALTFADDTKLMKAITQLICKTLLQADLDSVIQWSIANNMLLHEDKFVVMNYNHKAWGVLQDLPFTVEGKQYHTTKGNIFFIENFTITTGYQIQQ